MQVEGNDAIPLTPQRGGSAAAAKESSAPTQNKQAQNASYSASDSTGSTSQVSLDPVNAPNPFLSSPQSPSTAQKAPKIAAAHASPLGKGPPDGHRNNATSGFGAATEDPNLDEVHAPLLPSNIPNSTLFLPPIATTPDPSRDFRSAEIGNTGAWVQPPGVSGAEGGPGGASPPRMGFLELLQQPIICMARLTMPEVGMADHVTYPKIYAVRFFNLFSTSQSKTFKFCSHMAYNSHHIRIC